MQVSAMANATANVTVNVTVNGKLRAVEVQPNTLLVELLREHLRMTGTHVGCDTSQCGACTVHLDGKPVKSCTMLAAQAEGCSVTTIEGIGTPEALHPMQAAFRECHALQCGFCTPGMIMTAIGIVDRAADRAADRTPDGNAKLDEATVRAQLDGNFCRCTGYHNIVRAVLMGAQQMAAQTKETQHG